MEILVIKGGNKLTGEIAVSGAKNAAMKLILAGLLTDDVVTIRNIPIISSVLGTVNMLKEFGLRIKKLGEHGLTIQSQSVNNHVIPLEYGGLYRTATMVIGPLLARLGKATVPNPGGCRIGKRPINRHIEGLQKMGAKITYDEGYFYATGKLRGTKYQFPSNSHTGTETLLLAAVCAEGETILENAAEEPEVDDLMQLLNKMGAHVKRSQPRTIIIKGVKKLHGADFTVMFDRNEVVTFAIAAIASHGNLIVKGAQKQHLYSFLQKLDDIGGGWEEVAPNSIRFYRKNNLHATDVTTGPHPKFMTDWQAPWTLLMTQAKGVSSVHETVYEDRFGYVKELQKMGAKIRYYNPIVDDPKTIYNFNWNQEEDCTNHAVTVTGPAQLHNAVLEVSDLRAGATLLISALLADGVSILQGIEHIDRGYERIEERLQKVGADIKRIIQ